MKCQLSLLVAILSLAACGGNSGSKSGNPVVPVIPSQTDTPSKSDQKGTGLKEGDEASGTSNDPAKSTQVAKILEVKGDWTKRQLTVQFDTAVRPSKSLSLKTYLGTYSIDDYSISSDATQVTLVMPKELHAPTIPIDLVLSGLTEISQLSFQHKITFRFQQDTEKAQLVGYKQEGLEALVLTFSEPLRNLPSLTWQGFNSKAPALSADGLTVTCPIEKNNLGRFNLGRFNIETLSVANLVDLAGNESKESLVIHVDSLAPSVETSQVVSKNLLNVKFNEPVNLDKSEVEFDGVRLAHETYSLSENGQLLTVSIEGVDLEVEESHLIKISNVSDVYGNIALNLSKGISSALDNSFPVITKISQQMTSIIKGIPYFTFKVEFSEYVTSGLSLNNEAFPELSSLLNSFQNYTLNGQSQISMNKENIQFSADRKSAIFRDPDRSAFNHLGDNSLTLKLRDSLGNEGESTGHFSADVMAPKIGSSTIVVKNEKTLVIPLTNNDVEDVKLQPKDKWSGHAFRKGNVTKIGEQYWLELNFEEKLPEQVIQRIDLKDKFGNSNDHLFSNNSMVPYHVEVESPEVTSVSAFTSRLVELRFSHRVNSIGSVKAIKDGKETILKIKKFDSAFVDNTVVVEFADILPSGVYTLVFENVRRSSKSFAVSKELKVEGLSNQKTNFLVSPFFSHANHLNVELSTALDVNKLKISAAKSIDEGTDEYNLLVNGTDIKIELSAMTERGTVFAKIWPLKADKFISQSDEQKLQISIDDDEKKDFLLSWSTKPIAVLPELTNVTASSINIRFAQEIDCNMVSFEVFDNQGKPVEINKPSASVSPYYSYYLLLKTPFENKLAKGHYRIVLTNVKSAAFGFANSNPIEFEFEIK